MKIGYIILCHKEPELVRQLIRKVTEGTENIAVVHVDAKSDIEPFVRDFLRNNKVTFVEKRTNVYWGGFSSIEATMNALEIALSFGCERYVLLQGCDFPLHSNEYINDFFEKNSDTEFLRAYNVTKSRQKNSYMRCCGYHLYDGVDRQKKYSLKTIFARALTGFNKLGIKYRKGYYIDKVENKKYEVYWGWAHFAITKNCAEYLLSVYKNNTGLNHYLKYVFPADETYIQTIIYNSEFVYRTADKGAVDEKSHSTVESMLNLTYFEYPSLVRKFEKEAEIANLDKEKYLFIRKVKSGSELAEKLSSI